MRVGGGGGVAAVEMELNQMWEDVWLARGKLRKRWVGGWPMLKRSEWVGSICWIMFYVQEAFGFFTWVDRLLY